MMLIVPLYMHLICFSIRLIESCISATSLLRFGWVVPERGTRFQKQPIYSCTSCSVVNAAKKISILLVSSCNNDADVLQASVFLGPLSVCTSVLLHMNWDKIKTVQIILDWNSEFVGCDFMWFGLK